MKANQEVPIQLIDYDAICKKYNLTVNGENFLNSIKKPYGIISISGFMNSSISSFKKKLYKEQQQSQCRGINIWPNPINFNNINEPNYPIYVIEIEIFRNDNQNYNADLLLISFILSSYFVYNSVGTIDDLAISNLNFLYKLESKLMINNFNFPGFLWVLHDFPLSLDEETTSDQYLENILNFDDDDMNQDNNLTRIFIKKYFNKRECLTFSRKNSLSDDKHQFSTGEDENLFKLISVYFKENFIKHDRINGEALALVLKSFLCFLNSETQINFDLIWENCYKERLSKILEQWFETFKSKMKFNDISEVEKSIKSIETCYLREDFKDLNNNEYLFEYKNKALLHVLTQKFSDIKGENEKKDQLFITPNSNLQIELNEIIKQKDLLIISLTEKIDEEKQENSKLVAEITRKSNDEKIKEKGMKYDNENSNLKFENSVLTQKIDILNKMIEDLTEKENQNIQVCKMQIFEQSQAFKDQSNKYEEIISKYKSQVEESKDKLMDYEYLLENKDIMNDIEKNKHEDLNKFLNASIKDLSQKYNVAENLLLEQKTLNENLIKSIEQDNSSYINELKTHFTELENKFKLETEKSKQEKEMLEKENSHLRVNNDLYESQLKEIQTKIQEQKTYYDNLINQICSVESTEQKNDEMKIEYQKEKTKLEEIIRANKNKFEIEINNLTKKIEGLESNKNTLQKENFIIIELNNQLRGELHNNSIKKFNNEENNSKQILKHESTLTDKNTKESKLNDLINNYEIEKDDTEQIKENELMEIIKSNDELKRIIVEQKNHYEQLLMNEKNKKEVNLNVGEKDIELFQQNELLQKFINEQAENETNYENQIFHLTQKILALENYIKESKENHSLQINLNNEKLEKNFEQIKIERNQFLTKIDFLNKELLQKSDELMTLGMKIEQTEACLKEKEQILMKTSKCSNQELKEMQIILDVLKKKNENLTDELNVKKQEFTRENILMKQQIEYLEKNKEILQKSFYDNQKNFENKLFNLRAEIEKSNEEKFEKISLEKKDLEEKLNIKKKEIRESQNVSIKKIALLEKEIILLNEKVQSQEREQKDSLSLLATGREPVKISTPYLKFQSKINYDEQNTTIEQLKKTIKSLEEALEEKRKIIENDKILNENKFKYLETQKERLKEELIESQTKFLKSIEQLNKKLNTDKEKKENQSKSNILEINQIHQLEMKNLKDTYEKVHQELITANNEFESTLKLINNYLRNYESMKSEVDSLKKNFLDVVNENSRIKIELEISKKSLENRNFNEKKDFKLNENQKIIEDLRMKLYNEKSSNHINQLNDNVNLCDKKIEFLMNENEKLRNDKNDFMSQNFNQKHSFSSLKTTGISNSTGLSNLPINKSIFTQETNISPSKYDIYSKNLPQRSSLSFINKNKSNNVSPIREISNNENYGKGKTVNYNISK